MFHLKDGLFFERRVDGAVRVVVSVDGAGFPPPAGAAPVIFETTVDVDGFASVVASMSARGETADTWKGAVEFLGRSTEPVNVVPPSGEPNPGTPAP